MLRFFTINTVLELICLIAAIICLAKDKSLAWRGMILLLLITCAAEMLGIHIKQLYLADREHVHPNNWVYNILLLFQAGLYSAMFCRVLSPYIKIRSIVIVCLLLLAVSYVWELSMHGPFKKHTITTNSTAVLLVVYSFLYYYYLLKDHRYINLKVSPAFWWVTGVLFFYYGSTALNIFYVRLRDTVETRPYIAYIYKILNVLLYGCMTYAFICRKWLTKNSEN